MELRNLNEPTTAIPEIHCAECGKLIIPGNRPDGLPNGVGLQFEDGSVRSVCTDCIIRIGEDAVMSKDKEQ